MTYQSKSLIIILFALGFSFTSCYSDLANIEDDGVQAAASVRKSTKSSNPDIVLCPTSTLSGTICESPPDGNLATTLQPGGPTMHHEIEIDITSFDWNNTPLAYDPLYESGDYYATLRAMPSDVNFYERIYPNLIQKVNQPLCHGNSSGNFECGQSLTICDANTITYSIDEWRSRARNDIHGLAQSGIYKIERGDLPPVYFAFPITQYMWFSDGPDMTVLMQTKLNDELFCDGNLVNLDIFKFGAESCEFCSHNIWGHGLDKLVSTQYNDLKNYWGDNVVTVGFGQNHSSTMIDIDNTHSFHASVAVTDQQPPSGNLIAHLQYVGDDKYEIYEQFNNNTTLQPGDEVVVRVEATFDNGELLEHQKTITLSDHRPEYGNVRVEIRGMITDQYNVYVYTNVVGPPLVSDQ